MSARPGRGSIDAPAASEYQDPDAPPEPSKAERLASLRERTAEAKAGISRYQRQKLVEWWSQFYGTPPDETVSAEEMARQFLDPPSCQWTKNSPLGFLAVKGIVSVLSPDGGLRYLDPHKEHVIGVDLTERDAQWLLEAKAAQSLPVVTVKVLAFSWRRMLDPRALGYRGELVLYRGTLQDRFLEQAEQFGEIEIVQDGRYTGKPESLGPCPTPREKDPKGRTYLEGYEGAVSRGMAAATKRASGQRTHDPLPKSIDALIPDLPEHIRNPEWYTTPEILVRPNTSATIADFVFEDQKPVKVCEWLAAVLNVRTTRHGEPILDFIDTPSEPGQRFRAAVAEFAAMNPNAKTDDVNFPVYAA